ncbi:carnitine O-acetyltransferase-like [Coccinella septempunctata]|uniref:carnitine O-acetyltransferase-like n=1 Tax=Coccinella septempunctata TaxID=41139 RepID=UPI001D05F254|nr:carnitine O-acetyltransferase-like [Coccinella septempunctata]
MNFSCTKKSIYVPFKNILVKRSCCELAPKVVCKPHRINPQNLPLLPIPKLEHTLSKFLKSAEPFVTHCELTTARDVCQKFWKHEGYHIQQLLIQRARASHNWLDEWYLKCSYLCNREGLPMNTSPVVTFPTENFASRCNQINYAAKIILGVLKFRQLIQERRLRPETWRKYPLDMGVYKRLFSHTRIPKVGCDELVKQDRESHHIIVVYNNNFFKLVVTNDEAKPLSLPQLLTRLEDVLECGYARGEPFGILTSMKRDRWSKVYAHMKQLPENDEYLEDIQRALFVVCLDECSPLTLGSEEDRRLIACLNGFHGHGPAANAANRWYDKTLQFFVSLDGSAGIIFEHSPVDAIPLGKMADFLVSYLKGEEWLHVPFLELCEKPKLLSLISSNDTKIAMKEGCVQAQEKTNTFSCQVHQYDKYGKGFCKDHDVSPDAIVQLAIQLAHVTVHGNFVAQQEIATTRRFFLGRNDVVRSCSCEMVRFIKSIDDPLIFLRDRFDYLKEAVRVHRDLCEDAMGGRAIDCHLFGLMMACKEAGLHLPKVFQTRAYLRSSKFKILSMQVPMESDCFVCYPPGCHGGYGVCYIPRREDFNICVTCRRNDCDTNSKKLVDYWSCGMKKLSDILCGYERRKKKLCD